MEMETLESLVRPILPDRGFPGRRKYNDYTTGGKKHLFIFHLNINF